MIKYDIELFMEQAKATANFNKKELNEAICWMILGDGCIEQKLRGNYQLAVTHIKAHYDYILWKAAIIELFTGFSIKEQKASGYAGTKDAWRLRSSAHPWFTSMWNLIYGQLGRKSLPPHALALLGPLGLAILYQDDGSYHYSPNAGHNIMIHKLCFSEFELLALTKNIVDKFGIIFRLNECKGKGLGFRLRLRASDKDKFFELIRPYVVPSMLYKIGMGDKSDDLVRCSGLIGDYEKSAEMTDSCQVAE